MFKETKIEEPAECETLYMELAFRLPAERKRMISIGVLEKDATGEEGTISFQIVTFHEDRPCDVATADLTYDEINHVIKALQEAQDMMYNYNN